MGHKKVSKRSKVNFNNAKVQTIISYIQLGENRITKEEIMKLGTKDIFYQFKNSGFIKETSKGNFQGTSKLHKEIQKQYGKHFSTSSSLEHSQAIRNTLAYIPKEVISRKSFNSSFDVEKNFNHYKQGTIYKEKYNELYQEKRNQLLEVKQDYYSKMELLSKNEKNICKLKFITQRDALESQIKQFEEGKPYLVSDYEITLTQNELTHYILNLENAKMLYDDSSKQAKYLDIAIQKLNTLSVADNDMVTISIEVVTNNYNQRELEMHRTYERLSSTPQILLYQP